MKCANCGFPLSPARSQCSRCGASVGKGQAATPAQPATAWPPTPMFSGQENQATGLPVDLLAGQQAQWGAMAPLSQEQAPTSWEAANYAFPTPTQATPPQMPGYYGQIGSAGTGGQQPQDQPQMQAAFFTPMPATPQLAPFSSPSPVLPPHRRMGKRSPRLGFTLAGLFLVAGALILVFVYVISLGLVRPTTAAQTTQQVKHLVTPTSITSLSPAVTPTPTFPGQQYIDNGQMASAVNTATAQTTTPATSFAVNQRIYVTFQVHPNGNSGGVCLLWYINSQQFSLYAFPVGTSATLAYSYAKVANPGAGYVEIYWSGHASCSDPSKLLGQRVNFTVTA